MCFPGVCRSLLTVLICAVVLAGCAGSPPPGKSINLSGYSSAFKEGYADGCDSARGLLTRKDEARYRDDADYMMGWNDGYGICRRRK
jgi:outer membrane PBP1 activator LpoA protein